MNESEARLIFERVRVAISFPFDVELRFRKLNASYGIARKQGMYRRITVARQFLENNPEYDEQEFYHTLLHEFCHLWGIRRFISHASKEFKEKEHTSLKQIDASRKRLR